MDRLNLLWGEVEKRCKGLTIQSDSCSLSTERHGPGIRLHYKGKPIAECKAIEKIEAATELEKFGKLLIEQDQMLIKKALEAEQTLLRYLNESKRPDPAKAS